MVSKSLWLLSGVLNAQIWLLFRDTSVPLLSKSDDCDTLHWNWVEKKLSARYLAMSLFNFFLPKCDSLVIWEPKTCPKANNKERNFVLKGWILTTCLVCDSFCVWLEMSQLWDARKSEDMSCSFILSALSCSEEFWGLVW